MYNGSDINARETYFGEYQTETGETGEQGSGVIPWKGCGKSETCSKPHEVALPM